MSLLNEFDQKFNKRGVPCIRYADDIVLLTKSERTFEKLLESSTKYLGKTLKLKDIRVIARALPTDKSRMVRICQEMNLVVGMTGDGVNDSPAYLLSKGCQMNSQYWRIRHFLQIYVGRTKTL